MSAETDVSRLSLDLISYLNEKTGSSYTVDGIITDRIEFLLHQGYTPYQLRTVIDKKCAEWLEDSKMRTYLRPSTLYGDKFSEYLNAPISLDLERKQDTAKKKKSLKKELAEKYHSLDVLKASLLSAPKGTTERRELKEQIAILEDSIKIIEGRLS